MIRILVVEDEPEMARLLQQALSESGYEVEVAANGRDGRRLFQNHDLIISDVMMPVEDGFTMVRTLRAEGYLVPAIFLTAKDSTEARVEGLLLGGDDYISKPFKLAELLARVQSILRRSRFSQELLSFGDVSLNTRKRSALRGERTIVFTSTEFQLLELLIRRAGETISKEFLLKELWQDDGYRDDNLVEVYIRYIRTKLEANGEPRIIHTLRGKGYVVSEHPPES